jgi:serine/threonine protein kinase
MQFHFDAHGWADLNRLLDEALDVAPAERAAWLDALDCGEPLKSKLRSLLSNASQVETNDFLGHLPRLHVSEIELATLGTPPEQAGNCIGPYRLVRELGVGGMGAVWLAARIDGLIPRPFALKLSHRAWRGAGLAERLARERAILAALTHSGIARLYDAGVTANGQPYLVIEYVEGQPIDAYCKANGLDIEARLRLFLQVANAVAYAHAKLVVHRDLKPSNILVTADGQARLLDFGIAKLLDGDHADVMHLTEMAGVPLTPSYASPEQILGDPITTATDVYSLGVVLYELLTATRPYKLERSSRGALEEAILRVDPVRPSDAVDDPGVRRHLRGDLDTITLKALKKKSDERYPTVNALVEDIERFLTHRPVLAQPDTLRYRYAKFVRRNKAGVAAGAAVLVAILTGSALALWQARAARLEERRASEVKEFLASTFRDADPYQGTGRALAVTDLLKQARARVDTLGARPELRVELLTLIGSSLLNLEDFDAAERAAQQALDEALATLGPDHEQTLHARVLMLGVHRFRGRTDEMRRELDAVQSALASRGDVSVAERIVLLESRGHLLIDDGKGDEAVAAAREAYDLALATFGERDARTASSATLLAEAYEYTDASPAETLKFAERAFRLVTDLHGAESQHPRVINARDVYGRALSRAGKVPEGIAQLQRALDDATEVFGAHSSTVGFLAGNLARYQRARGDISSAIANFDRALEIHARNVKHESFTYLGTLAARGIALVGARRGEPALRDLHEAAQGLRKTFGPEHEETLIAEFHRGLALAYTGQAEEAQEAFAPVLQQYRTKYRDPVYLPYRALSAAGVSLRLEGKPAAALVLHEEALRTIAPEEAGSPKHTAITIEIALDHLEQEQPRRALPLLEAVRSKEPAGAMLTPARVDVRVGLGRAHLALGEPGRALAYLAEADAFWRGFDASNRWAGESAFWLGRCQLALGRTREARATLARATDILSKSPLPADRKLLQEI